MQTLHFLESSGVRATPPLPFPPSGAHALASQAAELHRAYAAHGGVLHSDDLAARLRPGSNQPISQVARWIVARELVNFRWHGETLFPLFQFDLTALAPRPEVQRVIAELSPALDDLELAHWFVRPNSLLADVRPIDLIDDAGTEVLHAARAERFLVLG